LEKLPQDETQSIIKSVIPVNRRTGDTMAKRERTTTGDELMCSGRVGGYCCTGGTRRGTLVTNSMKGPDYDYVKRNISMIICDTGSLWS
jgi:hypothetical protein